MQYSGINQIQTIRTSQYTSYQDGINSAQQQDSCDLTAVQVDNINCIYQMQSQINQLAVQKQKALIAYESILKTNDKIKNNNIANLNKIKLLQQQIQNTKKLNRRLTEQLDMTRQDLCQFNIELNKITSNNIISQYLKEQLKRNNGKVTTAILVQTIQFQDKKIRRYREQANISEKQNKKLIEKIRVRQLCEISIKKNHQQNLYKTDKNKQNQITAITNRFGSQIKLLQQKYSNNQQQLQSTQQKYAQILKQNNKLHDQLCKLRRQVHELRQKQIVQTINNKYKLKNISQGEQYRKLIRQNRVVSAQQYHSLQQKFQNLIQQHSITLQNLGIKQKQVKEWKTKFQYESYERKRNEDALKHFNQIVSQNLLIQNAQNSHFITTLQHYFQLNSKNAIQKHTNNNQILNLMTTNRNLQISLKNNQLQYSQREKINLQFVESRKKQIQNLKECLFSQMNKTNINFQQILYQIDENNRKNNQLIKQNQYLSWQLEQSKCRQKQLHKQIDNYQCMIRLNAQKLKTHQQLLQKMHKIQQKLQNTNKQKYMLNKNNIYLEAECMQLKKNVLNLKIKVQNIHQQCLESNNKYNQSQERNQRLVIDNQYMRKQKTNLLNRFEKLNVYYGYAENAENNNNSNLITIRKRINEKYDQVNHSITQNKSNDMNNMNNMNNMDNMNNMNNVNNRERQPFALMISDNQNNQTNSQDKNISINRKQNTRAETDRVKGKNSVTLASHQKKVISNSVQQQPQDNSKRLSNINAHSFTTNINEAVRDRTLSENSMKQPLNISAIQKKIENLRTVNKTLKNSMLRIQ